jgi:hypothetical protein
MMRIAVAWQPDRAFFRPPNADLACILTQLTS